MIRVGTSRSGSSGRMSTSRNVAAISRIVPGLADSRSRREYHARMPFVLGQAGRHAVELCSVPHASSSAG